VYALRLFLLVSGMMRAFSFCLSCRSNQSSKDMDLSAFKKTISGEEVPSSLSVYLQALWFDGRGNWEQAHQLIQDLEDQKAAWIHAYLHRKEGDVWNADYWYRRAGRTRSSVSLEQEWEDLVSAFL
jgi:hypothetical protein